MKLTKKRFSKYIHLVLSILLYFIYNYNTLAYILTTPNNQDDALTDNYINKFINTDICSHYTSDKAINLKQAVNITIACNRSIRKLLLNRISENYSLDVAQYKFKPNMKLNLAANYTRQDNSLTSTSYKTANVTPQFNILTPIGTDISLDWENYTSDSGVINTFKNASHITIRQPLLKQSGIKFQTASVKNSEDTNNFQLFRFYDSLENEVNKTIFLFRSIIQNKNQLEIQQKTLDTSKKLYEQTKLLIKTGRLAKYELSQVESQVASQEVNLADAKINLRKSYLQLANQLGINRYNLEIDYPKNITDLPKPIQEPVDSLLKITLENNVAYQGLITQKNLQKEITILPITKLVGI